MHGRLRMLACLLAISFAWAASGAAKPAITVRDLTPKFLTFYRTATAKPLSADERFALWKKDYDFAAVPPTPEGDKMARGMLDRAWTRYPAALNRIQRGEPA